MRTATYRVQLNAGFTFDDAAAIAGYLADLGVSHLYCSPYLQAARGSCHGYDVTDHSRLNCELGDTAGHRRLVKRLADAGLRQVLDIVPNHMALAGRANTWWWDVLEDGPSSRYARYFDIDWDPPQRKLTATVLMPVLADHYGRVLEAGEISLERAGASFAVRYHEHEAPISPRTLDELLGLAAARAGSAELADLAAAFGALPHAILTDPEAMAERHRGKLALRGRLAALIERDPEVAVAIDAEVAAVNANPDALGGLLDRQNYRLAYWATAAEELSYRRFFTIETLAGLRMEREEVFEDTHRLILDLVADGTLDGLRVDHVDGLADPEGYLSRLAKATGGGYVVVEKVLAPGEELPASWPVDGTTGYDFLNQVGQLFTDSCGEAPLRACYARFTGVRTDFAEVAREAKLQIMRKELAAELERLTGLLADLCERHRRQRDHTRRELRDTLAALIASFGVYRTYAWPGRPVSTADREHVAAAVAQTKRRRPDLDGEFIEFLGQLVVLTVPGPVEPGPVEEEFAIRFAQLSAPVMAKGVEDTAFYRYVPLTSLNEVGGSPGTFGTGPARFHADMARAARRRPHAMLTLSSHDTKRSADVRARISLLAELPRAWEAAITGWAERNARHKRAGWPDATAEYLLYQTMVGAWPIGADRAAAFMVKAAREARTHTSWTDPSADYEEALGGFAAAILGDAGFVAGVESFLAEQDLVRLGRISSLAQTALLLTCPGIPDLYQGTETWDLSLVDPDNRRPVDYGARRSLLADLAAGGLAAALGRCDDGGPKLWLIRRVLAYRARHLELFGRGAGYQPLPAAGPKAGHAVAFARVPAEATPGPTAEAVPGPAAEAVPGPAAEATLGGFAVVVPRLVARLAGDWQGTTVTLPPGEWTDVLTGASVLGGEVQVSSLLRSFPVAVLGRAT